MAAFGELVQEVSTSVGTGSLSLSAVSSRRRFSDAHSTGGSDVFNYFIMHANGNVDEWEYGTGSLSDADTLVRNTVIKSSNSDAAVDFSVGTKDVTNDLFVTDLASSAQLAKIDFLTVTQAVDLDAIETRVNGLDAAVILKGTWDASGGSFPGSGSAQAGESWIVSTGGTVDSVVFTANDRIVAITDNASTSTYSGNWHKLDYTDLVQSVNGATGAVTLSDLGLGTSDSPQFDSLGLGAVVGSNVCLQFGGTKTGADNVFGVFMGGLTYDPANNFNVFAQYSGGTLETNASDTITTAYGFYAEAFSKGGTGTISTAYGMWAQAQTVATTNYSIGTAGNSTFGGQNYFASAATTASAANAYLDNATSPANQLKRSTSSGRYKKDVETLDSAHSDNVLKFRPVWFRSSIESDRQDWSHYGLIAEEVAKIDPRLVHYGYRDEDYDLVEDVSPDGEKIPRRVLKDGAKLVPDGVQYDRLTVLLIDQIQRLNKRIEKLEAA